MNETTARYAPGQVRDAIIRTLKHTSEGLSAKQIARRVSKVNGPTPESSVRSYLSLNTPELFVRGVLPLGEGIVVDPFAGAGSTLAAAESVGYKSIGVEKDAHYFQMGANAIQPLAELEAHS